MNHNDHGAMGAESDAAFIERMRLRMERRRTDPSCQWAFVLDDVEHLIDLARRAAPAAPPGEDAAQLFEATAERQDYGCKCLDTHQNPPECSLIANGRDCLCSYASEAMLAEAARLRKEAAR